MLAIQKLLRDKGLEYTKEYLNLMVKESEDLILLKYKQIEADWTKIETHQCRGIILNKDTFDVVSFPYEKFFNLTEGYAATIDWDSAKFYEKLDGSLINIYFYNGSWHVQTSGTIFGEANNYHPSMTFADLFWYTVNLQYGNKQKFITKLDTNFNYMFELCTPDNWVVKKHETYTTHLHGIRNMTTFKEIELENFRDIFYCAKEYSFKDLFELKDTFEYMKFDEEGYVIRDKYFNRVKIKNPAYVKAHHVVTGQSKYAIVSIIKNNELDEYITYHNYKKDLYLKMNNNYNDLANDLNNIWVNNLNCGKKYTSKKEFALDVFKYVKNKSLRGIFFNLNDAKINSIKEGLFNVNDKIIYNLIL